ncbi:hypothetical protein PSTT_13228 [Puccinia striiformis]|uniref:Uncharacterized protein n=1 Tax=Puccinia striiformis TaxID=27350 RepID=A0A2S4USG0_9BASI|nr:hypothetical protein PSTT_13228 [Puccinia striiformis]
MDPYVQQLHAEIALLARMGDPGQDGAAQLLSGNLSARQRAHFEPIIMYFKRVGHTCNYKCRWCFRIVRSTSSSTTNLRVHRDGSVRHGIIRRSCPERSNALEYGCNLPRAADADVNAR